MQVDLTDKIFDAHKAVSLFEANLVKGSHGGVVSFVGNMRDFNDGLDIQSMFLHYYPGMTKIHIEAVCKEAKQQWDIIDCLVIHRHGQILPGEPIVLVAVWSTHRANAFDACRYIINYLKERAPFWKQEITLNGEKRWVSHNTADPGVSKLKQSA